MASSNHSSDSEKTEYVMTVFHHDEDFNYFIEYYIPQIKCIKNNLINFNMNNVGLNIYIFTSVDISVQNNIYLLLNSAKSKLEVNQETELHNILPNSKRNTGCKKINCNHIIHILIFFPIHYKNKL